ncbi:MAG: DUF2271 domain-containing protein [Bacteroidota bacterium]
MKKIFAIITAFLIIPVAASLAAIDRDTVSYRCLIQLTNYGGEGAYVITSLGKPDSDYEKTLYVGGDDADWYPDLLEWFGFYEKADEEIDGITGASIQSGGRKVALLEIDAAKLNAGYKLRFESSVEDGLYHSKDIELDLGDNMVGKTIEGSGYIRYVRIITK